jgi:transcriptional regulator with XRE-family HTH domain
MIGERIKERRKALNMSQTDLGNALGRTKAAVSLWETGRIKPYIDTVEELAKVLKTTSEYLLEYTNTPEPVEAVNAETVPELPDGYMRTSGQEMKLLLLFRGSEDVYRELVIEILEHHQK